MLLNDGIKEKTRQDDKIDGDKDDDEEYQENENDD